MKTVAAVVLALALLAPGTAFSAYTYEVDRSAPCILGCSGNIGAKGFVEVDKLGFVTGSNFIDWELTFNSSNHANFVLTPDNSEVVFFTGTNFAEATLTELTVTIDGNSPTQFVFDIRQSASPLVQVNWVLEGGGGLETGESFIIASNISTDEAFSAPPDNFLKVALPATAVIPVPAALPLLGTGLAVLGLVGWRSRRGVRAC